LATNGDTSLGGDNVDEVLIDYIADDFRKNHGIDLKEDNMALQRLKEGAERIKVELSSKMESEINVPFITADASGPKHLQLSMTRAKFEGLVDDLVARTFKACDQALKDSGKSKGDINEVILVGGSTRIPMVQKQVKEFFGCEPHKGVNPDEVVAAGAAIQGGVLSGDVTDMLLLDVTPLSLGIETVGGVMTTLVERNTTIPVNKKEIFSTADNNQSSVTIHVLQGERSVATGNRTLANFNLDGIPPAPRGIPQIEVSFDIDADGILNVEAHDKATGAKQSVKVESSSGLSDGDIDQAIKDAEENAEQDRIHREKVQARNDLELSVSGAEKLYEEHGDKLSDEDKRNLDDALKNAKNVLEQEHGVEVAAAHETLQSVVYKISEFLYKTMSEEPVATPPLDTKDEEGDIIDAEAV